MTPVGSVGYRGSMSLRNRTAAGLLAAGWLVSLAACSDADPPAGRTVPGSEQTNVSPLLPSEGDFATFVDPDTGAPLQAVRDADREVVYFDISRRAMVSAATGDAVSGWVTDGNDLRWDRGGAFQVRFGSESGEARAYFTEAGPGTICNLTIRGPDQLSISATNETPPHT